MKKKVVKVLLCILLILTVGVAGVVVWQWDNLMAVKTAFTNSPEDIQVMIEENDERVAQAIQKVDGIMVRHLTKEVKEELKNGDLDREQVLDLLTSTDTSSAAASSEGQSAQTASETNTAEPAAETPVPAEEDANKQQLSRYLAEIYVMKAEYTAWLEQKYNEAIEEFNALDESERTTDAKYSIGMSYLDEALAKEEECDAEMANLEQKISDLLTEMGEDTSLVDDIQATYEKEKELKKAYYLGG